MAKKISYNEALAEIGEIISQIEEDDLDVDILGEKVKRVTELVNICKTKLLKTEKEISDILNESEEGEA